MDSSREIRLPLHLKYRHILRIRKHYLEFLHLSLNFISFISLLQAADTDSYMGYKQCNTQNQNCANKYQFLWTQLYFRVLIALLILDRIFNLFHVFWCQYISRYLWSLNIFLDPFWTLWRSWNERYLIKGRSDLRPFLEILTIHTQNKEGNENKFLHREMYKNILQQPKHIRKKDCKENNKENQKITEKTQKRIITDEN